MNAYELGLSARQAGIAAAAQSNVSAAQNAAASVKLSRHAQSRLETRNIEFSDVLAEKVARGLDEAERKGVKEPLLMLGDLAFVANTKSRTIITAAGTNDLRSNVFTNIDGAVIL